MMLESKVFVFSLTIISFSLKNVDLKDCESKEIRNYQDLKSLKNCTAILGNLAVSLNEKAHEDNYLRSSVIASFSSSRGANLHF